MPSVARRNRVPSSPQALFVIGIRAFAATNCGYPLQNDEGEFRFGGRPFSTAAQIRERLPPGARPEMQALRQVLAAMANAGYLDDLRSIKPPGLYKGNAAKYTPTPKAFVECFRPAPDFTNRTSLTEAERRFFDALTAQERAYVILLCSEQRRALQALREGRLDPSHALDPFEGIAPEVLAIAREAGGDVRGITEQELTAWVRFAAQDARLRKEAHHFFSCRPQLLKRFAAIPAENWWSGAVPLLLQAFAQDPEGARPLLEVCAALAAAAEPEL
ncbi:MAG TPA: hypothetical protein VNZ52_00740 [Candidatus Thermoplasmatota archaeon]|nr:hypothetical protein [Candidatus Thermoplasmatota archaeon]